MKAANTSALRQASGAKASKPRSSPKAISVDERVSVSVRKISNGYIVSKSHDGPKGYSCTEEFTAKMPVIDVPKAKPRNT